MARAIGGTNLYQRGETWWGRVKLAGREHRSTLRTTDRREAARRFKTWRIKLERETVGDRDAPLFQAAAVKWAEEVLPNAMKPATAARYLVSVRQLDAVFGQLRMDQIGTPQVAEFVSRRSLEATNATIRRDLTALSRLLAACVSWGWRTDNPARDYDRSIVREQRQPIQAPRRQDVAALLAACPPGMAAVLSMLDQTGMREAEAVTLEASQIDWRGKTITLTKTKTNRPRTLPFVTPGGNAMQALAGKEKVKGTLFPSERESAYNLASFSGGVGRVMRDLVAAAAKNGTGFRRFRVHDLRHGFAIRALQNGMGIYALSRHLGHSSVKTTEGYLGYLTTEQANKAARA